MLAVEKKVNTPLKEFCKDIIFSWPEIYDHLDLKLKFQKKDYLSGFYVENFFNDKVLNFKNEFSIDQRIINNEINNFIIGNRDKFSNNNLENNSLVQDQMNKIDKIYKKIISQTESNLDIIIKDSLYKIVRYKIFVNDIKKFQSFSCNWKPGRGIEPYVKKEKFSEFENI